MKNPSTPLIIAALAALLTAAAASAEAPVGYDIPQEDASAQPQLTKDGKIIMPDDFVGPLAPNQIYKRDAALGSSDFASTINNLQSIGNQQRAENGVVAGGPDVIAFEDQMKKDGTLKDLIRSPNGAIYVFPDGTLSWSDYVGKFNTMPFKPADCMTNPSCPAALRTYAVHKAESDKVAKETDKKDADMFGGKFSMFSNETGGDKNAPDNAQESVPDPVQVAANDIGLGLGSGPLSGEGPWRQTPGAGSSDGGGYDASAAAAEAPVGKLEVPADMNGYQYTYTAVKKAADESDAYIRKAAKALGQEGSADKAALDPNAAPSKRIVATQNQ